jgi:hypothetical protein
MYRDRREQFEPVHAKTVKNTENTAGQKNEIQRKNKENNYRGISLVLRKNCILKIQVQRGLYFTVFFQIQRANIRAFEPQKRKANRKKQERISVENGKKREFTKQKVYFCQNKYPKTLFFGQKTPVFATTVCKQKCFCACSKHYGVVCTVHL